MRRFEQAAKEIVGELIRAKATDVASLRNRSRHGRDVVVIEAPPGRIVAALPGARGIEARR